VDRTLLARALQRLGDLMLACPRIREIDINPLLAANGVPTAVDASIVLQADDPGSPPQAEG
jgi:hypothetical protein